MQSSQHGGLGMCTLEDAVQVPIRLRWPEKGNETLRPQESRWGHYGEKLRHDDVWSTCLITLLREPWLRA